MTSRITGYDGERVVPTKTTYGYTATWSDRPKCKTTLKGSGFSSMEDCEAARQKALSAFGYTQPRWWQWWRWSETRYRAIIHP